MLSEHISNATPSQIEALRRRQRFMSSLDSRAAVNNGSSVNNSEKSTPQPTTQLHHAYVDEAPVIASPPSQPINVRYVKGSATSIIKIICKGCAYYFNVDYKEIMSKTRTSRVTTVRQIAYQITREITGWSQPEIGRRFGGKDHTTILSGIRKIERLKSKDTELADKIERLKSDVIAAIKSDCPEFTIPGERQCDVPEQQGEGAGALPVA